MSCKKSTELIEKSKVTSLTLKEKIFSYLHLSMCTPCTKYKKLSNQLDLLIEKALEKNDLKETISKEKKQEILYIINQIKT